MLFTPSRDEARRFLIEAWRKRCSGTPASGLEIIAGDVIAMHPEYHALLAAPDALSREWTPEDGATNPFLHLALHLAIAEQLSIDQPPGIRALFAALSARHGDAHAALHDILDCLGEMVWRATRERREPDGAAYLDCIRRKS
jgi:hypothetical protein